MSIPHQRCRAILVALSALGALLLVGDAHANSVVLDIQEQDIYIDMGHDKGVAIGSTLTLEHVISAVHPVSKQVVRDTFPLGPMQVINVGPTTCIARVDPLLFPRVRVGDEVSLSSPEVRYVDSWLAPRNQEPNDSRQQEEGNWKQQVATAKQRIATDEEMVALWQRTLGQSLEHRRALWQGFLNTKPDSVFTEVVYRNLVEIEARMRTEAEMAATTPNEQRSSAAIRQLSVLSGNWYLSGRLVQNPPTRGYEGQPIPLALLAPDPEQIAEAWLYYRPKGGASYERAALVVDGDSYLRGRIPGGAAKPPSMEYFIEVLKHGAEQPEAALGSSQEPERVVIDASAEEEEPSRKGHSRVTLFMDYVDFDGPKKDYDQYIHAEVDFMYRFFRPIYSLRLGFGTMSGKGGPKDVIDLNEGCELNGQYRCNKVGYNYAFAEVEERFTDLFAIMLRLQWGSAFKDRTPMAGVNREFFSAFGARARIRLGRELETNLVLGVAKTQRLGQMYEGAFTWDVIPNFPVVLAVQVTDQPVLEDFGVRLISDVGWRHFDWVYPSIRIAYQARDIDHAGLSAGLAANFDW